MVGFDNAKLVADCIGNSVDALAAIYITSTEIELVSMDTSAKRAALAGQYLYMSSCKRANLFTNSDFVLFNANGTIRNDYTDNGVPVSEVISVADANNVLGSAGIFDAGTGEHYYWQIYRHKTSNIYFFIEKMVVAGNASYSLGFPD